MDDHTELGLDIETTFLSPHSEPPTPAALAWENSVEPPEDDQTDNPARPYRWPLVAALVSLIVAAAVALVAGTYHVEERTASPIQAAGALPPIPEWTPPPMPHGVYKATGVDGSSQWGAGGTPRNLIEIDSSTVSFEHYDAPECGRESCELVNVPVTDDNLEVATRYHYANGRWVEDSPSYYFSGGFKMQLDSDVVPDGRGGWQEQNIETVVSCPDRGCGNLPIGATMSFRFQLVPTAPAD